MCFERRDVSCKGSKGNKREEEVGSFHLDSSYRSISGILCAAAEKIPK